MSHMRINDDIIRQSDVFAGLLDHFPDMIHSIDDSGRIIYANRTAETLLGYSREELLSMNITQVYADEILDAVRKGFSDLKQQGTFRTESILKDKQGARIPVEIRSFGIYDDQGAFSRTFSILRDTRPIKELQNGLVHAGRLAAIGELSAGVAHDINNPLMVILLSTDLLRDLCASGRSGPEVVREAASRVEDIEKASRAIQKLSEHLRNFSRGMVEQHELVDIAQVVEEALFITGSKLLEHSVRVKNSLASRKYITRGNFNQLEQVFVNLIANACDAVADRETRELTLDVVDDSTAGDAYWLVRVGDTGPGVPEGVRESIFRSFFTTKPKGKGTGLGLAIARGILNEHDGRITLVAGPAPGAVFQVALPKIDPSARSEPAT